jgi:hypothetical protein
LVHAKKKVKGNAQGFTTKINQLPHTWSSSFSPVFAALTILDYAVKKPYALNMQDMKPLADDQLGM